MRTIAHNPPHVLPDFVTGDSAMIDSVTAVIPCHGTPVGRLYVQTNANGDVGDLIIGREALPGPFGLALQVKSTRYHEGTFLTLRGSVPKFLQGHNEFASRDMTWLLYETIQWTADELGFEPTQEEIVQWMEGDYDLLKVDIAGMIDLGSEANVSAALDLIAASVRSRHARYSRYGSTVFLGEGSDRWGIKFYGKHEEILQRGHQHGLPAEIPHRRQLLEFAQGKLRIELQLGKKALKAEGLTRTSAWKTVNLAVLLRKYLGKLYWTQTWELPGDVLATMPWKDRFAYAAWRQFGHLLFMPQNDTFQGYRDRLLKLGIDVKVPFAEDGEHLKERLDGRSVRELLSLPFCAPPAWALCTPIYKDTVVLDWLSSHPKILDAHGHLIPQPDIDIHDLDWLIQNMNEN